MFEIYFNDKLIAETEKKENIQKELNNYTKEVLRKINPIILKIKNIEDLLINIPLKQPIQSIDEYIESLRKTNPDFINQLETLAEEISKENYIRLNLIKPTISSVGWSYKIGDTQRIQTLNSLRMNLRNQIPNEYNIEIKEYDEMGSQLE